VRVFCHDARRLGLHWPVRHRLTGYGVKPSQSVEPLYASYWLYAAVEPTTGDAFWWEWPRLDADCFSLLLDKCSQPYTESLNSVLLDQAPAHGAQRVPLPEEVVLVWWPAYSPALNPVERLWEDLKARIDVVEAQVRSSLTALQAHGAGIVQDYSRDDCLAHWLCLSGGSYSCTPILERWY
jgi:DDE superfamily endonuclease